MADFAVHRSRAYRMPRVAGSRRTSIAYCCHVYTYLEAGMANGEGLETKVGAQLARESPESSLWFAWKRASELVRAAVIEEVTAATGLSDPDLGILLRLDVAGGSLRQSEIASALGWDRTRLSHQLTRMEDRGLLARRRTSSGVWVDISDVGEKAASSARPVHAAAVRRHLIEPLTPGQSAMLREILGLLSSAAE
jgi:DNA-binding MarR family transcriptional regulator